VRVGALAGDLRSLGGARGPEEALRGGEAVAHLDADRLRGVQGIGRPAGEEGALQDDRPVGVDAGAPLELRLRQGDRRVVGVADVAETVVVQVRLVRVRDRGTVVVGAADAVAVGIATTAVDAGAALAGIGQGAGVRRARAAGPVRLRSGDAGATG